MGCRASSHLLAECVRRGTVVRSWLREHWRVAVAGAAVVSLVAGVGVWVLVGQSTLSDDAAVDCSVREVASFADAAPIAAACQVDVEVVGERTPWQTSWSTAEGLSRLDVTAMPSRVLVDGEWAELDRSIVDPRLEQDEPSARGAGAPLSPLSMTAGSLPSQDSMLEVQAPVFPIELNPGGPDGQGEPLGRIQKDAHEFAVWFPVDLPEPQIDGSRIVYDLGVGVRLFVTVNIDATGFIPVVELQNPASLAHFYEILGGNSESENPADVRIEFPTHASDRLTFREDGGTVELIDVEDTVQFLATAPSMWDSRAGDTVITDDGETVSIDRSSWPAEGDNVVPIGMTVEGTSLVITPDSDMLSSGDTVWPVYIDPPISGKSAAEWVAVRTGGYTDTRYKWGDMASGPGQGTGYCSSLPSCNVQFYQRLAWEFTGLSILPSLASSDIQSASFRVQGVHSANCTAHGTTVRRTSDVSAGNTWTSLTWHESGQTRYEAHSEICKNRGFRNFNALVIAQWGATNNQTALRMGLRVDEASITYWKRFRHDATFSMVYNRAPSTPTQLLVQAQGNSEACHSTTGPSQPPAVSSTTPNLSAILEDPDSQNVRPSFELALAEGSAATGWTVQTQPMWTLTNGQAVTSGQRAATNVPYISVLSNGATYAFRVRASDVVVESITSGNPVAETSRTSPWSAWCLFTVDTSDPSPPIVTSVRTGVQAVYEQDMVRGGAYLTGAFLISRGASTDVERFEYTLASSSGYPDAGPTGEATISYTPILTGPQTLSVVAVDAAGNRSDPTEYEFNVGTPREDAVWTLDEGTGSAAAQSMGTELNPLIIDGATWAEGPHSLFQSRQGDFSLRFDGSNEAAVSERQVLDTTASYVVSAHVLLDADQVGNGSAVAVSQDGVSESAFRLQYVEPCPSGGSGCWAFTIASSIAGQPPASVVASTPVRSDEWTHLVASYNATENTAQLWTCDIGTPTSPQPANPIGAEATAPSGFTPLTSTGGLAVGRALTAEVGSSWWQGQIDNVRVLTGQLVDLPKIRRLCQGAEATDFSTGEVALDPTVEGE